MLNERLADCFTKRGDQLRKEDNPKSYAYYKVALTLMGMPELTREQVLSGNVEGRFIGPSMKTHMVEFLNDMEQKVIVRMPKLSWSNAHKHYTPHDEVLGLIQPLIDYLNQNNINYVFGGSYRRDCELVGDIDILIFEDTMPTFDGIEFEVESRGTKLCKFKFKDLEVDLRLFKEEERGAAMIFYTGPKNFNIYLRMIAKKKGFKLNEYCLENVKTGEKFHGSEQEIMNKIGLNYIPPRDREKWR